MLVILPFSNYFDIYIIINTFVAQGLHVKSTQMVITQNIALCSNAYKDKSSRLLAYPFHRLRKDLSFHGNVASTTEDMMFSFGYLWYLFIRSRRVQLRLKCCWNRVIQIKGTNISLNLHNFCYKMYSDMNMYSYPCKETVHKWDFWKMFMIEEG